MSRGDGVDLTGIGSGADFKPRLGRIRGDHPNSFIAKVNKAVARARAASGRTKYSGTSGRFNARGRGSKVAPGLKRSYGWSSEFGMRWRARRVIVKARVVKLKGGGATWLDRTLLKGGPVGEGRQTEIVPSLDMSGFGGDVHRALIARQDKLIEEGFAERETGPDGNMIRYRRNMLAARARRELMRVGKEMAADLGKDFAFAEDGARISGTYRGNVQLASGKYALVERSKEFSLVPWRSRLDRELGRDVAGVMRGRGVSWEFGRQRSRGLSR
ncbi:MAG: DUF3363 domain-containing protein [Sphingomonadales bacterium]